MKYIQKGLIGLGVVLYLGGINYGKRRMLGILFVGNFLLSLPQVFKVNSRYGIDYIAYLQ